MQNDGANKLLQMWNPYSAARAARNAPWGWRLWAGVLAVAVLIHMWPNLLPMVALAGLLIGWQGLHGYASSYSLSNRSRSRTAFLSLFSCTLAFLAAAMICFGWQFQQSGMGSVPLILLASVLGIWLAYGVVRHWWKGRYSILAGLTVPVVGSLSIWAATVGDLPEPAAMGWTAAFPRVLLVLLTVGIMESSVRPRAARRIRSLGWLSQVGEMAGFAAIASALLPLVPANLAWNNPRGIVLLTMVVVMVAYSMFRARFRIAQDVVWYRRAGMTETALERIPFGVQVSFACLPAIMVAPLVGSATWLACYVLCVMSVILQRIGYRDRTVPQPRRPSPSAPGPEGRLTENRSSHRRNRELVSAGGAT